MRPQRSFPRIALQKPRRVVGNDTVSAMQSGIFWGHAALIEGMIARIKAERNEAMTVVATGGVASLFHDTKAMGPLRSRPDNSRSVGGTSAQRTDSTSGLGASK
jgi:pantothenate kinase type III